MTHVLKKTKFLVIDDIIKAKDILYFFKAVTDGIIVNKRGKKSFTIYPQLLLICQPAINKKDFPEGVSFDWRFDVIEFPVNESVSL